MTALSAAAAPREVPASEAAIFAPRRSRYALVIPVINEGERIRRQLTELAALPHGLDVVVADGGSTDGSLDDAFLRESGVRARLVKKGPGRLGAQLRMAYDWVLREGYDGVVTVDGNGKDGLEALPHFTTALDSGCGYVQGSRYIRGGVAVNTPLDRYLAGRFIHSPLVSLGARRWLTDTTNGFRAYSRAALADPRVAPFRAEFGDYALLFYLSVRLPRLGYRTAQVPVRRSYPPSGKTPTKISGLKGRLAMMGELLAAVTGRFNP